MEYIYSEIQAREGAVVEVAIDQQANVRLLDPTNYHLFKSGQRHQYYGGRALRSPIHLPVPSSGRWYVVIDLGVHGGTIRHNIRLIS